MPVFTVTLGNSDSLILFVDMVSVFAALVFVTLNGLFIIEKIIFLEGKIKKTADYCVLRIILRICIKTTY